MLLPKSSKFANNNKRDLINKSKKYLEQEVNQDVVYEKTLCEFQIS